MAGSLALIGGLSLTCGVGSWARVDEATKVAPIPDNCVMSVLHPLTTQVEQWQGAADWGYVTGRGRLAMLMGLSHGTLNEVTHFVTTAAMNVRHYQSVTVYLSEDYICGRILSKS
jgi:hypothetical protein